MKKTNKVPTIITIHQISYDVNNHSFVKYSNRTGNDKKISINEAYDYIEKRYKKRVGGLAGLIKQIEGINEECDTTGFECPRLINGLTSRMNSINRRPNKHGK